VKLLVSVADAAEARAAIEGGADIIDAKDPAARACRARMAAFEIRTPDPCYVGRFERKCFDPTQ